MSDPLVYLNGKLIPASTATISVFDRGFMFGDGIYDVIPVYQRKMFRAKQHLERLFKSLAAVGISNPHSIAEWNELIGNIIESQEPTPDFENQIVYIQVSRGVAKRAHAFPQNTTPTVFIMSNPMLPVSDKIRTEGAHCVTMQDQRWLHCDIKSTSLLGNVLAAQFAVEHDALESIQFRDGYLTEASSSNVWIVSKGILSGPPKDHLILQGIRYDLIEQLCATQDIPLQLRRITEAEVFNADEVLLSSATKEILPVSKIDQQTIGSGAPGPIYQSLYRAYQDAKLTSAGLTSA